MKHNEREIAFYEVNFRPSAPTASPTHNFQDLVELISSAVDTEFGRKSVKIDQVNHNLELLDLDHENYDGFIVGFIVISDSTVPAPARRNVLDKSLTVLTKDRDQEDEFGCHFFLKKQPENNGRHKFYLERATRLGVGNIQILIRHIFSSMHKEAQNNDKLGLFSGPHNLGKNKDVGYGIIVDLLGIPSSQAASIVNEGYATKMYLSQDTKAGKFGGKVYLRGKRKTLRVNIDAQSANKVENLFDDIRKALKSESNDWSVARISYETPDGDKGSMKLDTDTGKIVDDKLVQQLPITGITPSLSTSAEGIVKHFAEVVLKHDKIN